MDVSDSELPSDSESMLDKSLPGNLFDVSHSICDSHSSSSSHSYIIIRFLQLQFHCRWRH